MKEKIVLEREVKVKVVKEEERKKQRNFDSKLEERSSIVTTTTTSTINTEKNKWMDSIVGAISEKPISTENRTIRPCHRV